MTDSHKAYGKAMEQEPPDKFDRRYGAGHDLVCVTILVIESDHPIVYRNDSVV